MRWRQLERRLGQWVKAYTGTRPERRPMSPKRALFHYEVDDWGDPSCWRGPRYHLNAHGCIVDVEGFGSTLREALDDLGRELGPALREVKAFEKAWRKQKRKDRRGLERRRL